MKFKHLVFDWDGTLADTYPVISQAYEYTFKSLQLKALPYKEIKRLTSTLPNKDILGYIFGSLKDEAKSFYYDYIAKHHTSELKAMPCAEKLLKFCRRQNFKIYLISNKQRPYLLEEVAHLGFSSFFDKIVAAGDSLEDKPGKAAALAAFDNDPPAADSILVIGDGEADYNLSRAYDHNGKKAFCLICDSAKQYSGPKPDFCFDNLQQVLNFLSSEKNHA